MEHDPPLVGGTPLPVAVVQAKRKYQEILEAKNVLEADNEELKLKYQSKAQ